MKDYDDIRIVLGFQAEKVIEVVNQYRKDLMFVFNNDYRFNGPAASLTKGMINSREYLLSIDGDILVSPDDFKRLLDDEEEYLAVSNRCSSEPILVEVEDGKAFHFSIKGNYEWPGIVKIRSNRFKGGSASTYELIEKLLPIKTVLVNSRDIDTPDDYDSAIEWVGKKYKD